MVPVQLSLSHLGYLPRSPKLLTLLAGDGNGLADSVPFYIRQNCLRMRRDVVAENGFSDRFPAPYDLLRGKLVPDGGAPVLFQGVLKKTVTRWGTMWQADFAEFDCPGSYQIETDQQISVPFAIHERVYDRIISGYLTFLRAQRCGCAIFGVHDACHLDDGVLDRDGSAWPATGGWHDAGDFRKWLAFTLYHVEALLTVRETLGEDLDRGGIPANSLLEEVEWGNRYFHRMINSDGQVYEDVAGGSAPIGSNFTYEDHWWFENHPGCYGDASDNRWTDNVFLSGDERKVRTNFNPLVQWAFVHVQARASRHLPPEQADTCLRLARQAASFAQRQEYPRRTLFVAAELRAKLELLAAGDESINKNQLIATAQELLQRQAILPEGLSGYFTEGGGSDAYRSIAFAADPALALLRFWELRSLLADDSTAALAQKAVVHLYRRLPACRQRLQSLWPDSLRSLLRSASPGSAEFSRCPERSWRAHLHPPLQFSGHRPRHKFRAHEPCAPAGSGCRTIQPDSVALCRRALASLVPRTQHAQSLAVLRHRLSAAGRILFSHSATSRGDVRRIHRAAGRFAVS